VRGCLFVLVTGALVVALIVVVGLPAFADGVLTAGVRAAGLEASDTTVTVTADPPTDLLALHADRVRVRATQATFRGLEIGALDVTFEDVGLVDRTARTVDGRLADVMVRNVGAKSLALGEITLSGGGSAVVATATLAAGDARTLIVDGVASDLGGRPSSVVLSAPDRVTVGVGIPVEGRFLVDGSGSLLVRVLDGPAAGQEIVLLRGGEDLPIRLTSVTVTAAGGLRLVGELTVGLLG
jgi:hypothetical protein